MKNIILSLFLLVTGITSLQAQPQLRLASVAGVNPYSDLTEIILKEAYHRIEIETIRKDFPGERSLIQADTGVVDGLIFRVKGIDNKYPNLVKIPVVIAKAKFHVFTHKVLFKVDGIKSMSPYKIGIIKGIKAVEEYIGNSNLQVSPTTTAKQALQMLKLNRFDIVLLPKLLGLGSLKANKIDGIKMLPPLFCRLTYIIIYIINTHKSYLK